VAAVNETVKDVVVTLVEVKVVGCADGVIAGGVLLPVRGEVGL
jgi:hypothetical protein